MMTPHSERDSSFQKIIWKLTQWPIAYSTIASNGQAVVTLLVQDKKPEDSLSEVMTQLSDKSHVLHLDDMEWIIWSLQGTLPDFINIVFNSKEISNERKAMIANVLYFGYKWSFPSRRGVRTAMRAICEYYNKIAHFNITADDWNPKIVSARSGRIVENEFRLDGQYEENSLRERLAKTPYFFEPMAIDAIVSKLKETERVI